MKPYKYFCVHCQEELIVEIHAPTLHHVLVHPCFDCRKKFEEELRDELDIEDETEKPQNKHNV